MAPRLGKATSPLEDDRQRTQAMLAHALLKSEEKRLKVDHQHTASEAVEDEVRCRREVRAAKKVAVATECSATGARDAGAVPPRGRHAQPTIPLPPSPFAPSLRSSKRATGLCARRPKSSCPAEERRRRRALGRREPPCRLLVEGWDAVHLCADADHGRLRGLTVRSRPRALTSEKVGP